MTMSFVLRLVPGLGRGEIAGEVEAVVSGERSAVKSIGELMAFLERFLDDRSTSTPTTPDVVVIHTAPVAASAPQAHVPTRTEDLQ